MIDPQSVLEHLGQRRPDWAAQISVWKNEGPSGQHGLLVTPAIARPLAEFLRDDPELRLDYCSNVTGVDWPEAGYLEAVYHLYSVARRHGPLILRMRTGDRAANVHLPALTPVWKSAEFQEREIYDLYGIVFDGHPDLRRLLMWDEFVGHPMRKDFPHLDDMAEPQATAIPGGAA